MMFYDAKIKIVRMALLALIGLFVLFKYQNAVIFSLIFVFTEIIVLLIAYFIAYTKFIE